VCVMNVCGKYDRDIDGMGHHCNLLVFV
jgi:hypothetical protein